MIALYLCTVDTIDTKQVNAEHGVPLTYVIEHTKDAERIELMTALLARKTLRIPFI